MGAGGAAEHFKKLLCFLRSSTVKMLDGYVTVTAVEWILRLRKAEDKIILGISTIILIRASCEGYITTPFILPLPLHLYSLRHCYKSGFIVLEMAFRT